MRHLDPDDGRAPYLQVADAISEAITAGDYPIGASLPARADLAKHFGVAPMTVQNALRVLREAGTVVSRQGSGVFVRLVPGPPRDLFAEIDALRGRIEWLEKRLNGP